MEKTIEKRAPGSTGAAVPLGQLRDSALAAWLDQREERAVNGDFFREINRRLGMSQKEVERALADLAQQGRIRLEAIGAFVVVRAGASMK